MGKVSKKPVKHRLSKPVKPEKFVDDIRFYEIYEDGEFTIDSIRQKLNVPKEEFELDRLKIKFDHHYDGTDVIFFYYCQNKKEIPDDEYQYEMERYQRNYEAWKAADKKYKEDLLAYEESQLKLKQKEIEQLKKDIQKH